jgi:hypothetical protein
VQADPPAPPPRAQKPETVVAETDESVIKRSFAPLPPVRPYDLGVREASAAPKPPRRHGAGDRALYFAAPRPDPLARLLSRRPTRSLLDDDDN